MAEVVKDIHEYQVILEFVRQTSGEHICLGVYVPTSLSHDSLEVFIVCRKTSIAQVELVQLLLFSCYSIWVFEDTFHNGNECY